MDTDAAELTSASRATKRRWAARLQDWFFAPCADTWLTVLRWGMALQVIGYCLSTRADWILFNASEGRGLISRDLAEAILSADSAFVPRLGWVVEAGQFFGLNEATMLSLIWWGLISAGVLLLIGAFTRPAAIAAWFLHLCAVKSGALSAYGMDNFTTIGLFYLMIAPLPDGWSWDAWKRGCPAGAAELLGFHRRVLQVHLCVIYFFGGVTKVVSPAWWDGESIWRALIRAPFDVLPAELLSAWGGWFPLLGIGVCLLEVAYPVGIWPRASRPFWLAGIVLMHVGIGCAMGLVLFALIMVVLNLAAFGTDFWPLRLLARTPPAQPADGEECARRLPAKAEL